MHVYIDFVSISRVTSSCSISLNVGIVICIVSSVSGRPVNKIAKKKTKTKKTTTKNQRQRTCFFFRARVEKGIV